LTSEDKKELQLSKKPQSSASAVHEIMLDHNNFKEFSDFLSARRKIKTILESLTERLGEKK
jgi:hypothetical protein